MGFQKLKQNDHIIFFPNDCKKKPIQARLKYLFIILHNIDGFAAMFCVIFNQFNRLQLIDLNYIWTD